MPTYTIDGKSIRTDQALTDDELEELASGMAGPVTTGDYRAEAAKRGVTGTAAAAAGVSQMISDYLTRLNLNPFELGARAAGQPPEAPAATPGESFRRGQAAVTEPSARLFSALGGPTIGRHTSDGAGCASCGSSIRTIRYWCRC
jgi:hypothetical protein